MTLDITGLLSIEFTHWMIWLKLPCIAVLGGLVLIRYLARLDLSLRPIKLSGAARRLPNLMSWKEWFQLILCMAIFVALVIGMMAANAHFLVTHKLA